MTEYDSHNELSFFRIQANYTKMPRYTHCTETQCVHVVGLLCYLYIQRAEITRAAIEKSA